MKTLHSLTTRQLDKLQARIMGAVWHGRGPNRQAKIMIRIAEERLRRIQKELP